MTQLEINKNMSDAQLEYHKTLIKTQTKKKRKCLSVGCGKKFLSKNSSQRICDVCARAQKTFGEMAYISM